MKRAIIHMGMPKTATTSFQKALHQHRDILLKKHRILYPSISSNHTDALCPMFLPDPRSHITLRMLGIIKIDQVKNLVRRYFQEIESEMNRTDWDTIVFSAEGLSNLHSSALSQLRSWLDGHVDQIEVIYWLRHPVSFSTSVMQQMLKGGETIDSMMERMLPLSNYHRRLENAMIAFGPSTLRIYCFEHCLMQQDGPVAAFCEQIGVPQETSKIIVESATHENETISLMAGYILDSLNRLEPMFQDGILNPKRRNLDIIWLREIKGHPFILDSARRKKIREASRPEMEWLKNRFGLEFYPDMLDPEFEEVETIQIPDRSSVDSLALPILDLLASSRPWIRLFSLPGGNFAYRQLRKVKHWRRS